MNPLKSMQGSKKSATVRLGNLLRGTRILPLWSSTELSNIGNQANSTINSVTNSQVLYAISVFRAYHTQRNKGPVTTELSPPFPECLKLLTTALQQVASLPRNRNSYSYTGSLGDILNTYSAQSNRNYLEPLQSIKLDWALSWENRSTWA